MVEDAGFRIGISASVTGDPLVPHLQKYLARRGMKSSGVQVAPFNQIHQVCRQHEQVFGGSPDIIFLSWRLEDLLGSPLSDWEKIHKVLGDLAESVSILRQNFSGTLIVTLPACPVDFSNDLLSVTPNPASVSVDHLRVFWLGLLENRGSIHHLDTHSILLKIGQDQAYDARKWYLYRQPWSERFWELLARQVGRIICLQTLPAKKCIVLDADNTLWGGVVGEDGLSGIHLGNDFPGRVYKDFQKSLSFLQKKGILLAIASKNNEADFFSVLDQHDEMLLKREDFVAFEVHWNSKVESLKNIAKKLNIGLDSIVFIDDSGKEIGEVKERLPMVTCLQVPEEITDLPTFLQTEDIFDMESITEEDLLRTSRIQATEQRQRLQEVLSEDDYKLSLNLQMSVFQMQDQHVQRIVQLINKTNQFNLTTIRRSQEEIQALVASGKYIIVGMTLEDKYGDYGLVGVAIVKKEHNIGIIDTFLMSCRVLGRDAEVAFLTALANISQTYGCEFLRGYYVQTLKNEMVSNFYQKQGFSSVGDFWQASCEDIKALQHIVDVKII
ncbi:MAG: HAD-IIIC family phosphatase [Rhodospirillales bacterium]|nr:HAD-IIIC family phosphatase [Rhodospirillales bacterium]